MGSSSPQQSNFPVCCFPNISNVPVNMQGRAKTQGPQQSCSLEPRYKFSLTPLWLGCQQKLLIETQKGKTAVGPTWASLHGSHTGFLFARQRCPALCVKKEKEKKNGISIFVKLRFVSKNNANLTTRNHKPLNI